MEQVWVFTGTEARISSGVFSERAKAEEWIGLHKLSGTLSAFPMDIGVYDWAVSRGYFTPKRDFHRTSGFIERFSSASQEHYHYEDGKID